MTNSLSWGLAYAYVPLSSQAGLSVMTEGAFRQSWVLGISCL